MFLVRVKSLSICILIMRSFPQIEKQKPPLINRLISRTVSSRPVFFHTTSFFPSIPLHFLLPYCFLAWIGTVYQFIYQLESVSSSFCWVSSPSSDFSFYCFSLDNFNKKHVCSFTLDCLKSTLFLPL